MSGLRSLSTTDGRREGASPLRQQLKRETAALHQRLEAQLGLLEPELSIHRYRQVLEAFYGFYAPVEAGLARLAAAGPPLGFPLRARSELIESDLLALGLSRRELAELPRCAELPRLSCPEDLAGCLYVLEGACLGGQVIAPVLHDGSGWPRAAAHRSSSATQRRPRRGGASCSPGSKAWCAQAREPSEIVASARATFLTLARWVEQQGARSHVTERRRGRPDRL